MTDNNPPQHEINALEDACLGTALMIDEKPDADPGDTPQEDDPFFKIIMQVLQLRGDHETPDQHRQELDDLWNTVRKSLDLPDGAFEPLAQRGASLGEQLRSPPDTGVGDDDLVRLAQTDAGRSIWGVNAEGWDESVFEEDNVALGMKPDGTVEPVAMDSSNNN